MDRESETKPGVNTFRQYTREELFKLLPSPIIDEEDFESYTSFEDVSEEVRKSTEHVHRVLTKKARLEAKRKNGWE